MSSGSEPRGGSSGKMVVVVVLVIIGILAVTAGVIYLIEPAKSLPGILQPITHPAARANAHRSLRGWTALIVGVVCLVAALVVGRAGRSSRG